MELLESVSRIEYVLPKVKKKKPLSVIDLTREAFPQGTPETIVSYHFRKRLSSIFKIISLAVEGVAE